MNERRQYIRYRTWLKCWVESTELTIYGFVSNVSLGGLVIRIPVTVIPGSNVKVNLILGDNSREVKAFGKIAWQRKDEGCWLMGIQFTEIEAGKELLTKFLNDYPGFLIQENKF